MTQDEMICKAGQRVWMRRLLEKEQKLEDHRRELKEKEQELAQRKLKLDEREYRVTKRECALEYLQKSAALPAEDALRDSVDRKKLEVCIDTLRRIHKIQWEPMKETEKRRMADGISPISR